MNTKKILIVDDDFLNRRVIKKLLLENGYQVLEAKNAEETVNLLEKEKVDLAILDINLGDGEMDGVNLGRLILNKKETAFIYLTAYDNVEVISEAISTAPYSYLTKPFKNSDLIAAVELAIIKSIHENKSKPTILVKDGEYKVNLPLEDINYIESDGNYLKLYTHNKVYTTRSTITQFMEILPAENFVQTHRAYIVNKNKIEKYTTKTVVIENVEIPLSKKESF